MSQHLHIVCLDAPSPPNYGGAIDMFYKIKALADAGRSIILHYFDYRKGRGVEGLDQYCKEIHHYNRKSFLLSAPLSQPYIIASRINQQLIDRLNADAYPVLLEGLHCAGLIPHIKAGKKLVLRMHNEESSYYANLARLEQNPAKKAYYNRESRLLRQFQERMNKQVHIACLSTTDMDLLASTYHFPHLHYVPCFIPWNKIKVREGKGHYCLYHGNLAVAENEAAAIFLMEKVFAPISIPLVIAGNGISERLRRISEKYSFCKLVDAPPMDELGSLIADAHINVLPSMNTTGVKLKLLHALFAGRFCLVNENGVKGSSLEAHVHIADDEKAMQEKIKVLWEQDFTNDMITNRSSITHVYNNGVHAALLSALL